MCTCEEYVSPLAVSELRPAWDVPREKARNVSGALAALREIMKGGVSEKVARRVGGDKTRSAFDRYNIADESDLAEAADTAEQ
jgi:hypothetical protein